MRPALIIPTAGLGERLRMAVQIKQFIYTHAIKSDARIHTYVYTLHYAQTRTQTDDGRVRRVSQRETVKCIE